MLPAGNRLRRRPDFSAAVRHGRRAGRGSVVVHLLVAAAAPDHIAPEATSTAGGAGPRVGFVVGKAVGPAVVRNCVKRRLRHIVRDRLASLPDGSVLVVRASTAAAAAGSAALAADLDAALERVLPRGTGDRQRAPKKAGEPGVLP